jgi:hypothetical protein
MNLGRLTDIPCAAQTTGCAAYLTQGDLLGVVGPDDLDAAQKQLKDLDEQNQQLILDLKQQSEAERPTFTCAICLVEHEVEDCCTLPCHHRFCFESLQYHFEIIVRERKLSKLTCPYEGCNFNLRSEEHTLMFQQCLSPESYHKLLEFLTRDDPNVYECKHVGCEEYVFLDEGDDFTNLKCAKGHRFCAKCDYGPHPWLTCQVMKERADRERKQRSDDEQSEALRNALAMGWKPCPKRCSFGGGVKAEEECDHVTCECGHEFCWACGVTRQVILEHDNRWHKPSCPYHTKPSEVNEAPKYRPNCPECQKMPGNTPCAFPADDGYPDSYVSGSKKAGQQKKTRKARDFLSWPFQLSMTAESEEPPRETPPILKLCFHDSHQGTFRTIDFMRRPLDLEWDTGAMPLTISKVTPGGEAQKAGVMRGWWIFSVNDVNLLAQEYQDAAKILSEAVSRLPEV